MMTPAHPPRCRPGLCAIEVNVTGPVVTEVSGRASCRWTPGNSAATQELEATISVDRHAAAAPFSVRFASQVPATSATDPGMRIKGVFVAGPVQNPLRLGMNLPLTALQPGSGLQIDCDREVDAATITDGGTFSGQRVVRGEPTCFVTVEVPIPLSPDEVRLWRDQGLVGYTPVVLAANVRVEGNQISWQPAEPAFRGLQRILGQMAQAGGRVGDRILARLTLKGNFLWGALNDGETPMYLDGHSAQQTLRVLFS